MFAFGGRNDKNNTLNLVWCRNLRNPISQWTAKTPMNKSRNNFASVVFENIIYVFGGNFNGNNLKNLILRSCERYDSQHNQWSTIESMIVARKNASAAVYNSCIYIAGGINAYGETEQTVEMYDPQTDTWSQVASMITARSHFALTLFFNRIWAIGGMGANKQSLHLVESYDSVLGRWKKEESLNIVRIGHSAIEFNEKLYVAGGYKKVFKNGKI